MTGLVRSGGRAGQGGDQANGGLLGAGVGVEVAGGGLEVGVAEEFLDCVPLSGVDGTGTRRLLSVARPRGS